MDGFIGDDKMKTTEKKLGNIAEPASDEIQKHMEDNRGMSYYNAREQLRERAHGGKPPNGYRSWGDYWKQY